MSMQIAQEKAHHTTLPVPEVDNTHGESQAEIVLHV